MAFFLFIDESGHDHGASPYEVLAGIAVEDRDLWNMVCALQEAERRLFGTHYEQEDRELKAKKLLNRKTFRLAAQLPPFADEELPTLARQALEDGQNATKLGLTALAQSKLRYVQEALEICTRFRCRAFASIVDCGSPQPASGHLRKDYTYLFERFFYFLEEQSSAPLGIVVFDELEKSKSHLLTGQMADYFQHTTKGRQRASHIIPEPLFVHSDLTTGIQLADFVAYIISWNVRFSSLGMSAPRRDELDDLGQLVCGLRHLATREIDGRKDYRIWSFAYINDLRPRNERLGE